MSSPGHQKTHRRQIPSLFQSHPTSPERGLETRALRPDVNAMPKIIATIIDSIKYEESSHFEKN